jgi:DNA primase
VLALPATEDPDSLIRAEGGEAFRERLRGAPDYFGYMRALVQARGDKPAERERAVRRILEDLTAFPEGDLRLESLLEELSTAFGVERAVLLRTLRGTRRGEGRGAPRRPAAAARAPIEAGRAEGDAEALSQERREKLMLAVLLSEGPERETVFRLLRPEHFADPLRARLFSVLAALGRVPGSRELGELFPDPAAARAVTELTFLRLPAGSERDWVRTGALRLKLKRMLDLNRDFQGRVQAMELAGEEVSADLLEEWRHVGEAIRGLRAEIDRILEAQKGT